MPLIGRFSFLLTFQGGFGPVWNVSMPLIGRFSFLRKMRKPLKVSKSVSMPLVGQILFLLLFRLSMEHGGRSVNALSRANPISTLPFWNRLI